LSRIVTEVNLAIHCASFYLEGKRISHFQFLTFIHFEA